MSLINQENVSNKIYQILRNGESKFVILDRDLAEYYQTEPKLINKAAKRNPNKFNGEFFKLTKEEYLKILEIRKRTQSIQGKESFLYSGGQLPSAFTEEGALALSGVLESQIAISVFKILLKSFFAFRQIVHSRPDLLIHQEVFDLKNRMLTVEKKLEEHGSGIVIQHLTNQGQMQIGSYNSMTIKINGYTDIIRLMSELLDHQKIKESAVFTSEIKEAIILSTKEDKKGLLEKIESISNITNGITDLATKAAPILLPILTWLMS